MGRRTLGIGVINFAYWLAKTVKTLFDGSANNLTHKPSKPFSNYLLKASNELAKEQGARPWFNETTLCKRHFADRHLQKIWMIVNETAFALYDWQQLRESRS